MTYPDAPSGPANHTRLYILIGVVVVIGGYILYKRQQSSSGSSSIFGGSGTNTASLLGGASSPSAYGPTAGLGSVVPVIIQTPGSNSGSSSTSSTSSSGTVTSSVPSPVPSSMVGSPPPATWNSRPTSSVARVPNPSFGSQLVTAKVPVFRSGNAWYYNPSSITRVATPAEAESLSQEGYALPTYGGNIYYNPLQKAA